MKYIWVRVQKTRVSFSDGSLAEGQTSSNEPWKAAGYHLQNLPQEAQRMQACRAGLPRCLRFGTLCWANQGRTQPFSLAGEIIVWSELEKLGAAEDWKDVLRFQGSFCWRFDNLITFLKGNKSSASRQEHYNKGWTMSAQKPNKDVQLLAFGPIFTPGISRDFQGCFSTSKMKSSHVCWFSYKISCTLYKPSNVKI